VFGSDEQQATVIASQALLAKLNREQMQGVAATLVGSIANGDMAIGMRVAMTLGLFGLIARPAAMVSDGRGLRRVLASLAATAWRPTPVTARRFIEELSDPFGSSEGEPEQTSPTQSSPQRAPAGDATRSEAGRNAAGHAEGGNEGDWRTLLWLPVAGPVIITGFFGGLISMFLLEPLVSLAWRQRKYMADATAVRLTRDPDTLAGALERMSGAVAGGMFASWAAHLSVVRPGAARGGLLGRSIVPSFPSLHRRLRALAKLGAHITARAPHRVPLRTMLILAPLIALVPVLLGAVLFLLVWLSAALSMLFLGLPFSIVHMLLRWLGH
jgi:hypothetical protein